MAEWKLQNFHGATFNYDPVEEAQKQIDAEKGQAPQQEDSNENKNESVKENNKKQYTEEQIAALEKQFPDINWRDDAVAKEGIDALNVHANVKPALMPIPELYGTSKK